MPFGCTADSGRPLCHVIPTYFHRTAILSMIRPFFGQDCRKRYLMTQEAPPSDDIGRKKETPMNSTPGPKAAEPRDASIAGADERLTHAHEEIKRADEQLARLSEQVARMERNAARAPSTGAGLRPPAGRRPLGALIGLPLAGCIVVAALVWQSSVGGGAKPVVEPVAAPSPPQLVSSSIIAAGKSAACCRARATCRSTGRSGAGPGAERPRPRPHRKQRPKQRRWLRPHRKTPRRHLPRRPCRRLPQQLPIRRNCCKRWRAILRTCSEASSSSRPPSNKWPATMQKRLPRSRRARKR